MSEDLLFEIPESMVNDFIEKGKEGSKYKIVNGKVLGRSSSIWLTNIDHGRRHQPLSLMTMADNIKFSKHKEVKGKDYQKYDNYDAIDVPYTDAIPSDYEGVMGVPISFLDKYCPEQFEIVWRGGDIDWAEKECDFYTPPTQENACKYKNENSTWRIQNPYLVDENDNAQTVYQRILIRKKQ